VFREPDNSGRRRTRSPAAGRDDQQAGGHPGRRFQYLTREGPPRPPLRSLSVSSHGFKRRGGTLPRPLGRRDIDTWPTQALLACTAQLREVLRESAGATLIPRLRPVTTWSTSRVPGKTAVPIPIMRFGVALSRQHSNQVSGLPGRSVGPCTVIRSSRINWNLYSSGGKTRSPYTYTRLVLGVNALSCRGQGRAP